MNLPREVDARSRADGVTLRDLVAAIPRDCWRLSPLRAWGALARAVLCVAGLVALLAWLPDPRLDASLAWTAPATVALWLLLGFAMAGLFVIGHDCGHMAFSERRWVNVLVGHLCFAPLYTSYWAWVIGHNHHHVHTNVRRVETNWPEQMLSVPEFLAAPRGKRLEVVLAYGSAAGVVIGNWIGLTRYMLMDRAYPQVGTLTGRDRRNLYLSNLSAVLGTWGLLAALAYALGPWLAFKLYFAPLSVAATTGAIFTLLHHLNEDALVFDEKDATPLRCQVVSTFDVRYPWIVERLCFDINLHLVHHLTTRVPWYHLRAATRAIREAFPAYYQERRFSLGLLRRLWARPVLERHEAEGFYSLVPVPAATPAATPAAVA